MLQLLSALTALHPSPLAADVEAPPRPPAMLRRDRAARAYARAVRDQDAAREAAARGDAPAALAHLTRALSGLDEVVALLPYSAEAYHDRALLRQKLHDLDGALGDYDAALRLGGPDADALNNRGLALAALGHPHTALQDYDAALELMGADGPPLVRARLYYNRGNALMEVFRPADAVVAYGAAIAERQGYARALFNRALAYSALGLDSLADADLTAYLLLAPDDASAYEYRAAARQRLGNDAAARGDLEAAIQLILDDAETPL